ncbi:MAG: MFS transporter [Clostridiales bacterium]
MGENNNKMFFRFIIVWIGQLISNIGNGLTAFTLGVFIYQETNSATSYSLVILCAFLPSLILKPLGGVFADRFDRRLMMIIGDVGASFGLIFIFFCMINGDIHPWQIYFGAIISSVFAAFQNPAYKASVSDFVPKDKYGQASGLMQLATTAQYLISPVLAGVLFAIMEMKYILLIDISTFLIAALAVIWVRKGQEKTKVENVYNGFINEFKEGISAITIKKGIVFLITITSILCFYIGFLQTLLGPMMLNIVSPKVYGISQSVCASGLLVSSLLIGVFGGIKKHVKTLTIFLAFIGIFYSLMGISTNVYIITIFGFMFFFVLAFVQTSLEVLIRQNIDNEKQGRVWSIISVLTQLGYPIAYALAGILADKVFDPMFINDGILVSNIGKVIGVGQGRGIGFMFIIFGGLIVVLSLITSRVKTLKTLEQ